MKLDLQGIVKSIVKSNDVDEEDIVSTVVYLIDCTAKSKSLKAIAAKVKDDLAYEDAPL
jgi:hypothetical protein